MNSKALTVLLVCGLAGVLALWLWPHQSADEPIADTEETFLDWSTDEAGLSDLEDVPEDTSGMAPARRLPGVSPGSAAARQAATNTTSATEEVPDPDFLEELEQNVEFALEGNRAFAVEVGQLLLRCRDNFFSEDRVRKQVERAEANGMKPGTTIFMGNSVAVTFEDMQQFETFMWEQHDKCATASSHMDDNLRERIAQAAERGVPTARYLYAMWPPERDVFSSVYNLTLLDYHNRALEYTWLNLEEGEQLGVLAMGQSYTGYGRGLFTPVEHNIGRTFLRAAEQCGIRNEWLVEQNERNQARMGLGRNRTLGQNLERDAAELRAMFCR